MTTLREAAQQALEALEFLSLDFFMLDPISPGREAGIKAIIALRAALAESEKLSEPVAWMHTNGVGHVYFRKKPQDKVFNPRPVYLKNE